VIAETLLDTSISDKTILLRPVGGQPVPVDVVSYSYNVVNVAPQSPLLPNTSYEVEVVEGGIKDAAGNAIQGYKYYFSTGTTLTRPQGSGILDGGKSKAANPLTFRGDASGLDFKVDLPGPYRVAISDLTGRAYAAFSSHPSGEFSVSTTDWPKGIYQLWVTTGGKQWAGKRILIP
ncbi:MAG: Ig-like domain-containing protein, partial [Fibrobacterota bacterium]|nr:Ig-like domain-containing protein [Fibrobacterota bacterium]